MAQPTHVSNGTSPQPTDKAPPLLESLRDLAIIEAWDSKANKPKYTTFYHVTPHEVVFFGQSFKDKRDMTLEEYGSALERIKDDEIYPEIPSGVALTVAPDNVDNALVYIKRPGLICYEIMRGTDYIPKELMNEALTMEQVSKLSHPNIVKYYGCRVKRGRITAIVLEALDKSLMQYSSTSVFQQLDKEEFFIALSSAVDALHSLGLAHNDINPHNIMVRDGMPVLIDFGSCQPFGKHLQSLGTEGWREELFYTSEKKHDEFSLKKLREWLQKPE